MTTSTMLKPITSALHPFSILCISLFSYLFPQPIVRMGCGGVRMHYFIHPINCLLPLNCFIIFSYYYISCRNIRIQTCCHHTPSSRFLCISLPHCSTSDLFMINSIHLFSRFHYISKGSATLSPGSHYNEY